MKIWISNARIWDGEAFSRGDIFMENGIIMESGIIREKTEQVDFHYDAAGNIVSPGLVDIHTHMRGISSQQYEFPAEMACIPFGVTAAAEASACRGSRALLDSFLVKNVVFVCTNIRENHGNLTRTEELLQEFGDKAVGLKVFFDTSNTQLKDITPLKEICEYAHERGLIVMVHSSNSPVPMAELLSVLGPGDILSHAYHGGKHTTADDRFESLKRAKERGVIIDVGMAGYVHTDFGVLKSAIREGAWPDTISTDITCSSAYKRGGIYGMTMCMSVMREAGLPEEAIFKAVTSRPAEVLGQKSWGRLAVDEKADLAVFEYADQGFDMADRAGNRIYSEKGYRCLLTVVDGQIMYRR